MYQQIVLVSLAVCGIVGGSFLGGSPDPKSDPPGVTQAFETDIQTTGKSVNPPGSFTDPYADVLKDLDRELRTNGRKIDSVSRKVDEVASDTAVITQRLSSIEKSVAELKGNQADLKTALARPAAGPAVTNQVAGGSDSFSIQLEPGETLVPGSVRVQNSTTNYSPPVSNVQTFSNQRRPILPRLFGRARGTCPDGNCPGGNCQW